MKIYQSSFHTVKFTDLQVDWEKYYLQRPDKIFFEKVYEKWASIGNELLDEKNFTKAKKAHAVKIHDLFQNQRKILSVGIGNGITESELLNLDPSYKIDGIDFVRDKRWDSRIQHFNNLKECNGSFYDGILLNSVIYNFSDTQLRDLVSSLHEIIVEGGRIIVWEQDLPTLADLKEIKLRHSRLPKEGKGVILWGDLRSPSKIKNFFKKKFRFIESQYYYVCHDLRDHETRPFFRIMGYKLWQNKKFHKNTSQLHIFEKTR
jgi:hypothetical protein